MLRSLAHNRCVKLVQLQEPFEDDIWDDLKEDAFETKPEAAKKAGAGTRDSSPTVLLGILGIVELRLDWAFSYSACLVLGAPSKCEVSQCATQCPGHGDHQARGG